MFESEVCHEHVDISGVALVHSSSLSSVQPSVHFAWMPSSDP